MRSVHNVFRFVSTMNSVAAAAMPGNSLGSSLEIRSNRAGRVVAEPKERARRSAVDGDPCATTADTAAVVVAAVLLLVSASSPAPPLPTSRILGR